VHSRTYRMILPNILASSRPSSKILVKRLLGVSAKPPSNAVLMDIPAQTDMVLNGSPAPFSSKSSPYNIVFLRHGQSTWNRDNRFIGWTDTPLTEEGVLEARAAGQVLLRSGIQFDEVHTSLLRRAIRTVNIVLMELGQEYIPVFKHYRLNERMYGSLVGLNKKECVQQFGKDQVKRWRRSYDEPPPPMDPETHPYWPGKDPRYQEVSYSCLSSICVSI
jgi:hypothetical protein